MSTAATYALDRQYLHKSIIIITEKTPGSVTGVVLNRPTDVALSEGDFDAQIFYGGDQSSIHNDNPKFYCLHRLEERRAAVELSSLLLIGLYFTDINSAKNLVLHGLAKANDFLTVCRLRLVLDWSTSLDATALCEALEETDSASKYLLDEIDTTTSVNNCDETLDDRMLQQWSAKHLVFDGELSPFLQNPVERVHDEASPQLKEGDMLVATSTSYIFSDQHFHKSIVLVLQNDDDLTVAVLLNYPTKTKALGIPVRFGGT
jgi:hypothetical protein